MKAHKFIFFFTLLFATVCTYAQEITPSDTPNETQKAMLKRGYGMFIHFGVNTFSGDEWSDGTVPVSAYNPTRLDCDQWVRVARDAGFRYVLLITKHHDGFCLWDSKYTDYDVASSPVKTDVVGEVSKACKNTVCNLPSIIHCGTATNPYTKGKILANTLTICRIN